LCLQDSRIFDSRNDFFDSDRLKMRTLDAFTAIYGVKYERAVECLIKDREALLAFHDFPAEHWKYLRTTNAIKSTFAMVRHRFNDDSLWMLAIDCHQELKSEV
jgi:hypothetical protein